VDRYKQLLLKQRDIMLALTKRLNDRDEQILALQEELDAYDKYQARIRGAGLWLRVRAARREQVEAGLRERR